MKIIVCFLAIVCLSLHANNQPSAQQKLVNIDHIIPSIDSPSTNPNTLSVAVSEEFTNGLHARYFLYLAEQLGLTLDLHVMPFSRRLLELEKGNLDLMIGLIADESRESKFEYIKPSYATLNYRFFTTKENKSTIRTYQDLKDKVIAVKRASKYYEPFDSDEQLNKVAITSIEQSVNLLLHGRVDTFIHNAKTTYAVLNKLDVRDRVIEADIRPSVEQNRYIVISKKSHLMDRKQELSEVIKKGLVQKDFTRIRELYYQEITPKNKDFTLPH